MARSDASPESGPIDARRLLGIRAQLILCILRDHSAEYAMATLSSPFHTATPSSGLDSTPTNATIRPQSSLPYSLERSQRVPPDNALRRRSTHIVDHIRQCLSVIGVERIDHGMNVLESDELVAEAATRGIGFTVCPVSNRYVTGT